MPCLGSLDMGLTRFAWCAPERIRSQAAMRRLGDAAFIANGTAIKPRYTKVRFYRRTSPFSIA
jgi:hypothetical protein